MGKKAPKQTKAAASKQSAASVPKQPKQPKKKKELTYDSLRDPLDRELALVGLRVKQITADGNCFFRALSDQLEGNEGQHSSLRAQVVALMREKQEDFAPFVEDDQTFDAYIARMKKEGVWAGHMELQAASLLLQANIHIYQAGQPRWAIVNFPQGARELHLSYHDGEHYNSVRRADDYNPGPPVLIDSLATSGNARDMEQCWSAADEAMVAAGTGCDNKVLIQQQLAAAGGDVDAAIEAVIEILAAEDHTDQQQHDRQQQGAWQQQHEPEQAVEGATKPPCSSGSNGQAAVDAQQTHQSADVPPTCNGKEPNFAVVETDERGSAVADTAPPANGTIVAADDRTAAGAANSAAASFQSAGLDSSSEQAGSNADHLESGSHQQPQQQAAKAATNSRKGVKLKGKGGPKGKSGKATDDGDKRPSRNKPCTCGSGRKYKNCCELKGSSGSASKQAAAAVVAEGLPAQLATLHI